MEYKEPTTYEEWVALLEKHPNLVPVVVAGLWMQVREVHRLIKEVSTILEKQ